MGTTRILWHNGRAVLADCVKDFACCGRVGHNADMSSELRHIAVCLHVASPAFATQVSRGIARYVNEGAGWSTFVRPLAGDGLEPALRRWRGDGLICSVNDAESAAYVRSLEMPLVNVTGRMPTGDVPSVIGDDEAVGRMAAEHFFSRGFRHFACLGGRRAGFVQHRTEGFTAAVADGGGHLCEPLETDELDRLIWPRQLEHLGRWLKQMPKPVGLFAIFDALGHTVLDACKQEGLRVPEDVAVLGVDNDPIFCELSHPPLSSISQALDRRGYTAAALLDRLIDGESPPAEALCIPPDGVVERRSTDVYATADEGVRAALRYISDHRGEHIGVDDVAKAVHMSRRNLERRFRHALGRTVYDQLRHTRLETAKALLTDTAKPLLDVALDSGFYSSSDLSNAFRRHLGMTPSQYRQRYGR